MPLSDEQMRKVNQYFSLNGVVPDCPYCSMHGWDSGEIISATAVDEQGNARPEPVLMAQFSCRNCGHIELFDARRMGLLSG
jgi:predicted nucleic-acid-binding Zn-ribbon protein